MASSPDKDALTADLADARTRMRSNLRALRYDVEVLPRLKANITRNPLAWFSAAVIIGLLLSKIPTASRQHRVEVRMPRRESDNTTEKAGKAAIVLTALKFALDFARPALLRYITQRFGGFANRPVR